MQTRREAGLTLPSSRQDRPPVCLWVTALSEQEGFGMDKVSFASALWIVLTVSNGSLEIILSAAIDVDVAAIDVDVIVDAAHGIDPCKATLAR